MNSLPQRVWYLYLVRREDNALYTGITLDVQRRLLEHMQGRGAKALRGRSLTLVYRVALGDKSQALRAEIRVKALRKSQKEQLIREQPDKEELLSLISLNLES